MAFLPSLLAHRLSRAELWSSRELGFSTRILLMSSTPNCSSRASSERGRGCLQLGSPRPGLVGYRILRAPYPIFMTRILSEILMFFLFCTCVAVEKVIYGFECTGHVLNTFYILKGGENCCFCLFVSRGFKAFLFYLKHLTLVPDTFAQYCIMRLYSEDTSASSD